MNRLALKFLSNESSAELFETIFFSPLVSRELRCSRGRNSFRDNLEGTFLWSSAVMSMCAVFLKAKIAQLTRSDETAWKQEAGLSSDTSDWATSIDFALSKKPKWLLDMFGVDSTGQAVTKRLFVRMNPERKRPGPVWVSVNSSFLDPCNITIALDGQELRTATQIKSLLGLIGFQSLRASNARDGHRRVINLFPGTECSHSKIAVSESRNVLVPFLDHFILALAEYGSSKQRDKIIERECRLAFRLALLAFDCTYVPAVSYVQSPLCRRLVDEHRSFAELGAIRLISDAPTWKEFLALRKSEYPKHSKERALYSSTATRAKLNALPLRATEVDTTQALHNEWDSYATIPAFQDKILSSHHRTTHSSEDCTSILKLAAAELGSRAFIGRNLKQTLAPLGFQPQERLLTKVICDLFFGHYRSTLNLGILDDLAYGCRVEAGQLPEKSSFVSLAQHLRSSSTPTLLHQLEVSSTDDLWTLRNPVIGALQSTNPETMEELCLARGSTL